MEHYYVLFENHTDGIAMYNGLKREGVKTQISPTPRELSVCCGMSLLVRKEDLDRIRAVAAEKSLEYKSIEKLYNTFDSSRHRYG